LIEVVLANAVNQHQDSSVEGSLDIKETLSGWGSEIIKLDAWNGLENIGEGVSVKTGNLLSGDDSYIFCCFGNRAG